MLVRDLACTGGDEGEGGGELRHVARLDHTMKFGKMLRAEAELAAREARALDFAFAFQMRHVAREGVCELRIANTGLQVAPAVINFLLAPTRKRAALRSQPPPQSEPPRLNAPLSYSRP